MPLKHTVTTSIRSDAGAGISDSAIYLGDAEVNVSDVAAAGSTREVDVNVDVSQVSSFYIESDQAVTVKTNVLATPAQTFTLVAKRALYWNTSRLDTNPLTTDITKLFFVNATAVDANVKCGFLLNVGT